VGGQATEKYILTKKLRSSLGDKAMANRHLSRSIVLQTLFEWDFRGQISSPKRILKRNMSEFSPGQGNLSFMNKLLDTVLERKEDIDSIIIKAAPEWPLEKISIIDRNILRLGLSELLFADHSDVPPKVAINEAIELAKTFGADTSSRFVNGVLGAVYKEMGEPGKDDRSQRQPKIAYEDMEVERLVGAIVYAFKGEEIYIALVHDIFGHWTLSKGKLEKDEEAEVGTVRKIKEEIGLEVEVIEKLGDNEYIANDPERIKIRKQVQYFLAKAKFSDLTLGESGGLDDARWFKLKDILTLNFYEDILPIVTKAVNILVNDPSRKKQDMKI